MEAEKKKIWEEMAFPWDRQIGEPIGAYRLFCGYRDLGRTRSIAKIAELQSKRPETVHATAGKYQWRKRADAYDVYMDKIMRVRLEEEIVHARIRQQVLGANMQELAQAGVTKIMESGEVNDLRPLDVARLADVGSKIENLAVGRPSEIVQEDGRCEIKHNVEMDPELAAEIGRVIAMKKSGSDLKIQPDKT
ncbi:MAG: hypothetical protein J7K40_02820 [candidate division Zixibacteria bacterium]|nr:hypothetical protein [candidate division Zixibacteria bacterium]